MNKLALLLAAVAFAGCVSKRELDAALDRDDDGFLPVDAGGNDCDDADANVHPGAQEKCGDQVDNDCDGAIDDAGQGDQPVWFDGDGDGRLHVDGSDSASNLFFGRKTSSRCEG